RPEAATRAALAEALAAAPARLHVDLATRAVQTNETSRAVAWLWPAWLAGCGASGEGQLAGPSPSREGRNPSEGSEVVAGGRPLALADVGCSGGLNLIADALPRPWKDPAGQSVPTAARVRALGRLGLDARPLDVGRDLDVAWLRACIWPGET